VKKYLYVSWRGFANENVYYSVEMKDQKQVELAEKELEKAGSNPNYVARWITRKEAEAQTTYNRAAYRTRQANTCNPAGAMEITPITELLIEY
jgi:hypothetical protein